MPDPFAQPAHRREPPVEDREVPLDRVGELSRRSVERLRDLRERDADVAEQVDAVQTADVVLAVDAVAAREPLGRREQADLLVVAQGADGQAGASGHVPDPDLLVRLALVAHVLHARTFRGVRIKSGNLRSAKKRWFGRQLCRPGRQQPWASSTTCLAG